MEFCWCSPAHLGDPALPPQDHGLRVLGSTMGTDEYVVAPLRHLSVQHRALLQLRSGIHDLQVSWLLQLYCAFFVCTTAFDCSHQHSRPCLLPHMTTTFCSCSTLFQSAAVRVNQFLRHGGLGLRGAAEHEPVAYFASASSLSCLMTLHLPPHSPAV